MFSFNSLLDDPIMLNSLINLESNNILVPERTKKYNPLGEFSLKIFPKKKKIFKLNSSTSLHKTKTSFKKQKEFQINEDF